MTGGDRAAAAAPVLPLLLASLLSFTASDDRSPASPGYGRPDSADTVHVAVARGLDSASAYSDGGARLVDPGAEPGRRVLGRSDRYRAWTLRSRGGDVSVSGPGLSRPRRFDSVAVVPDDDGALVFLEGRPYRGRASAYVVEGHGLVLRSDVPLEPYVASVVSGELGPAGRHEQEAVKALAVASRTYAVRNRGRRDSLGADLLATADDQVYRGRLAERPAVTEWTRATAGEVIVHDGEPIRAHYHAACGGRTARPGDLWERDGAEHLESIRDTAADGRDYCRLAPLHRWDRRWSHAEVVAALERRRRGSAAAVDPSPADSTRDRPRTTAPSTLRSLTVEERSSTGRVTRLVAVLASDTVAVEKDALLTLFGASERGLPSTWFEIERSPPEADSLVVSGRGSGHGVGLCQWGAIGRARAGQGYRRILRAYYPEAEVDEAVRPRSRHED